MSEVPVKSGPISTVSDMMIALQEEIDQVKAGTLDESKARIVLKGRGLQLKTAELQLQYARLTKGRVPDPELRLITQKKSERSNNIQIAVRKSKKNKGETK